MSGSEIEGRDLNFAFIGDKAVSVGERSTVRVQNVHVAEARIGIVSKDGSALTVTGYEATQTRLYAGMAFIKKPMYGPAELIVTESVPGPEAFFNQSRNSLSVNDVIVPGRALDVELLYERIDGSEALVQ